MPWESIKMIIELENTLYTVKMNVKDTIRRSHSGEC